ncbi:MAG: hypothetical protein HYT62_00550 [Candidatus Yanofskybacteria bacterium]|nr:hypothetical protein [Candidatus Yanofskybacteria bacterium]
MKSTHEEIVIARELVKNTETRIKSLIEKGKKVHVIWDFDFVLASGLSDDVFALTGYNLEKYFEYESRLSWSRPQPGIWLPLAEKVGELQASQDIVTARSSFLAFRVMLFCAWFSADPLKWVRWVLFIGHQAKVDSFRIIFDSFKRDSDIVIFFVDDNAKHVEAFNQVGTEMGLGERAIGIISPKIRLYSEEQLELHYNSVMEQAGTAPTYVPGYPGGYINGFVVMPDGIRDFRRKMINDFYDVKKKGVVEKHRLLLENEHQVIFPGTPMTTDSLYAVFEILRGEAEHDTAMINELMEESRY